MLNGKYIAVVVPAFNEEKQIGRVIETIPEFVDRIVVVNDFSTDKTREVVETYLNDNQYSKTDVIISKKKVEKNFYNKAEITLEKLNEEEINYFIPSEVVNQNSDEERIILINNKENGGVGAAIARGYKWCKDHQIDCTVVMAGDGQMDPEEVKKICSPVIFEDIDYVKGNRLIHGSAEIFIPKIRYIGNSVLSILTKIASGYWRISDTQTGFTAISLAALNAIKIYNIYPRYGMPNDLLVKLNIAYCTIREIPIKPIYSIGEESKMKIHKVIPTISFLLFKSFFKRLWTKYFINDFHPLSVLYFISILLFILCIPFGYNIIHYLTVDVAGERPILNSIMFMFLFFNAFHSLLFAMWMDIQDNERLYK